jgi:hypothetical protein
MVSIMPQLHFTLGKGPPVPIEQEAGWAPELVWTQRLEEKSSASVRDQSLVVQSVVRYYTDWATVAPLAQVLDNNILTRVLRSIWYASTSYNLLLWLLVALLPLSLEITVVYKQMSRCGQFISVVMQCSQSAVLYDYNIERVKGQRPQQVSWCVDQLCLWAEEVLDTEWVVSSGHLSCSVYQNRNSYFHSWVLLCASP